jgi:hypothetical protein
MRMEKGPRQSSRDLLELISTHKPGGADESNEKSVRKAAKRFEPDAFQTEV